MLTICQVPSMSMVLELLAATKFMNKVRILNEESDIEIDVEPQIDYKTIGAVPQVDHKTMLLICSTINVSR